MAIAIKSAADELKAADDFRLFTTELSTNDPIRLVAQVMLGMTNAQGDLLRTMTANVTKLTDQMAKVNDLMSMANEGLTKKEISDTNPATIFFSNFWDPNDPNAPKLKDAAKAEVMAWAQVALDFGGAKPNFLIKGNEADDFTACSLLVAQYRSAPAPNTNLRCWTLVGTKTQLTTLNTNLQRGVDKLSAEVQQAQLSLQTLMGRYNGAFEVVTAAIKRDESQAQSVTGNIRK